MNRTERGLGEGGGKDVPAKPEHTVFAFVLEEEDVPATTALNDAAAVFTAAATQPLEFQEPAAAEASYDIVICAAAGSIGPMSFSWFSDPDRVAAGSRLLGARAIKANIADGEIVGVPQMLRVVRQQPALAQAADAATLLVTQLSKSVMALAPSLAAKEGQAVSPQVAYALAQEEQDLRAVEEEFGWLDSGGVAEQLGKKRSRTLASNLRAKGQLLGYARRGQQAVRYPRFQFDGMGVLPAIPELIAIANERNVAHEDLVFWLCSPTGMLEDDKRPVDMLRTNPTDVIRAARHDLGGRSW